MPDEAPAVGPAEVVAVGAPAAAGRGAGVGPAEGRVVAAAERRVRAAFGAAVGAVEVAVWELALVLLGASPDVASVFGVPWLASRVNVLSGCPVWGRSNYASRSISRRPLT